MWWMIPAAMAAMSAKRADAQAEQKKDFNLGQAEVTRYSPWTGMSGKLDGSYSPSALEGAAGGAIQGAGVVQGLGGSFGDTKALAPSTMAGESYMQGGQMQMPQQQKSPWDSLVNQKKPSLFNS